MADKKPYGDVTYADPGYQSDKKARYPIDTEEHAKAAWSYINQAGNGGKYSAGQLNQIKGRIKSAMRKFGAEVSEDAGRSEDLDPAYAEHLESWDPVIERAEPSSGEYVRSFTIEDVSVRATKTGREVTAYAAVFNTPTEIHDQDGNYNEELDPTIFNRALDLRSPGRDGRTNWKVGVFYNHAMTLHGTPSERYSVPVGVPLDIKADERGLLTVTHYHRSQLGDEIVEGIESGAIPGYSFSGRFLRSNPNVPRGGFQRNPRMGSAPNVRRMESTLREYGPTPYPAYQDAVIMGVRSDTLLYALARNGWTPELVKELINDGTLSSPPLPAGTPTGDPPSEEPRELAHSARSMKRQMELRQKDFDRRYPRQE
jgi:phage head maturation protease